jgi:flagellar biosynthesis GTPase FlhF
MAYKERIFFAGVGTTFAILAIGFGGGLLMASSTLHEPALRKVNSEPPPAIRVVHPASAEPALQVTAAAPLDSTTPAPQPVTQISSAKEQAQTIEKDGQAERAERRKAEAAKRERRKHLAEAKAKREAARAKLQQEPRQVRQEPARPGIMAFGGDEPAKVGFFGN